MPRLPLLVLLVVAAVAVGSDGSVLEGLTGGGRSSGSLEGTVVRVVDGDTIHVMVDGRREKVRYIGIDTPESVKPNTPVQCFAKAASAANRRLVEGRRVRLVLDVEERDRYGRLLAYVSRGDESVNERLVRDGYATVLTIAPNVRHADRFRALAREARRAGRGLWSACGG